MNWIDTNTLIAICTCAIGLTQFLFWRYIAKNKAYESEKGKNLATKQDIGEITKEIKSGESKFINETEQLKSRLAILANVQTDITSIERDIIVKMNKSLYTWVNALLLFPRYDDVNEIEKYNITLEESYKTHLENCIVFELFIDDPDMKTCLDRISIEIFNIHINRKMQISALKKVVIENETTPTNHSPNKKEKIKGIIEKYNETVIDKYDKITPFIHSFRKESRDRIYKLLNQNN